MSSWNKRLSSLAVRNLRESKTEFIRKRQLWKGIGIKRGLNKSNGRLTCSVSRVIWPSIVEIVDIQEGWHWRFDLEFK